MNGISIVLLNSRQPGKQTADEAKEKKKEMVVEKKNLEQVGQGRGVGGGGWRRK